MLESLYVKNLALIQEAEVLFGPGLNILSGETGAGKSIIIGSVNIALGGKVPKDIIRGNAEYAYIELIFSIADDGVKRKLEKLDIQLEDGALIISKKIMAGRSVSKINGESVPASKVREISGMLLDIHGQHEHQSLLHPWKHLEILDLYAKSQLLPVEESYTAAYHEYLQFKKELSAYTSDEESRKREMAFLEFEMNEIQEADLRSGEEEELMETYSRLSHGSQILKGLMEIQSGLGDENPAGALETVGRCVQIISEILPYDESLSDIRDQIYDLESLLTDITRELSRRVDGVEVDSQQLCDVQERLDLIRHLEDKYGSTVEDVLRVLEEKQREYDRLVNFAARRQELEEKQAAAERRMKKFGGEMGRIRREYAEKLEGVLKDSLIDLNFLDVRFQVRVTDTENFTDKGNSEAEFLISTNPGEAMRPLREVASGGELSRIMLAIKSVLADSDQIDTLIFDEIDAGISGRTAQKVSEKLSVIGKTRQVICISHLPQIVAMADRHFLIQKTTDSVSTTTHISCLDGEESILELARLLGGSQITDTVLENAREMKDMAKGTKSHQCTL